MTLRFFFLQAQYRSPIDLSDDALQAARKGYRKLMNGLRLLDKLEAELAGKELVEEAAPTQPGPPSASQQLRNLAAKPFEFLNDDLNTPRALAALFDLLKRLNTLAATPAALADISPAALQAALATYRAVVVDILGLRDEPRAQTEELLTLALGFTRKPRIPRPTTR